MRAQSPATKMLNALKKAVTRMDAFIEKEGKFMSALDYPLHWENVAPKDVGHLAGREKITFGIAQGPQAHTSGFWYMKDEKHLYQVRSKPMGGDDWMDMKYSRTPMNPYVEQVLQANIDLHRIGPKTALSLPLAAKDVKLPPCEPLDTFIERGRKLEGHLSSPYNKTWEPAPSGASQHLTSKERLLYAECTHPTNMQLQKESWYKKDDRYLYKFANVKKDGTDQLNLDVKRTPLTKEVHHILNSTIAHHNNGPRLTGRLVQKRGPRR